MFVDIITHLVGKFYEVEFSMIKVLIDDGVVVVHINIVFVRDKNDFSGFHDEFIGDADVFVEFADGELYVIKIFGGEKFHGGGNHEAIFLKHVGEGGFGREGLFWMIMAETFDSIVRKDFLERTDGDIGGRLLKGV